MVAISPSGPDLAWVLTFTGIVDMNETEEVLFHSININTDVAIDRSANLPSFNFTNGSVNTQGSYSMVIAVKPDAPQTIFVAGTSLFRSPDGFSTSLTDNYQSWIGGYHPNGNIQFYPNQHPDQHVIAFSPTDPKTMWVGHDGGIGK
ncbi:MAG: hypothetical protein IH889_08695, partial [Planctomycetes bacterium]|nr:hypothetical protein [Planctomycetota bacterium]